MIGSPNHVFFIYDGDDSDAVGAPAGPAGPPQIEKTFEAFYTQRRRAVQGHRLQRPLRLRPVHRGGIPVGRSVHRRRGRQDGRAKPRIWGGTAGQQYDPCYHLACDTFANNNDHALDVNSDAVAFATLQYAMNTSDINGVRGKGNFKSPPFLPQQ